MVDPALVYLVTNRINGKRYIGVTATTLEVRRYKHEWQALNGKRIQCRAFHAAIKKYGTQNFEWAPLLTCQSFADALREEIRLIAEIKPEYNLTIGGNGTRGHKRSEASRRLQSEAMRGRGHTPEAIAKIVAKTTGRKRTAEQRERMGAARRGKPFSAAHIANLKAARRRYIAMQAGAPNGCR